MKKNYYALFFISLVILMIHSCKEKSSESGYPEVISFSDDIEEMGSNEDIVKSIKYIKLESTENSMIYYVERTMIYNDTLFVLDKNRLLLFEMSGKFIKQFATIGRGPGEYSSAFSFTIDEVNRRVLINDFRQKKFHIYDMAGNFIESLPSGYCWQIEPDGSGRYIYYPMNAMGSEPNALVVISESGDTIKTYPNSLKYKLKKIYGIPMEGGIYTLNGELCFKQYLSDTLFRFNEQKLSLESKYIFENINTLPVAILGDLDRYNKEADRHSWITRVQETDENIFINYNQKGEYYNRVIYNKKEKKLYKIPKKSKDETQVSKTPFYWPSYIINDEISINQWSAFNFKNYFKDISKDPTSLRFFSERGVEDFDKFYDSVEEDDNTIIQIISIK